MNKEPLSNFDAFLVRLDTPTNMAVITGLMVFDKPVEFARLRATMEHRLLEFDRFRQRVGEGGRFFKHPVWEFDPYFNLDAHLHRIGLPAPGDLTALKALTNDLMSTPLDMSKPMWQMHLVESYAEGSALIVRLHHSIADGISLVKVLFSLIDFVPDAPWPVSRAKRNGHHGTRLGKLLMPPLTLTSKALRFADRLLTSSLDVLENPEIIKYKGYDLAADAEVLARYLLGEDEPKTPFRGACGVAKMATWSEPLPLEEVKSLATVLGGTINDVMLTAIAGGLRRYLLERDKTLNLTDLRVVVPFNMRTASTALMSNHIGMVLLPMPVGIVDPRQRFEAVKERMDALKESRDPNMIYGLLSSAVFSIPMAENIIVDMISSKASMLVTNVPGPQMQIYIAGSALTSMIFWVPQPAGWGLGLSIFSYNGEITLGVACDAGLVPDPEAIAAAFMEEYKTMQALASQPLELTVA